MSDQPSSTKLIVQDNSAISYLMDTARFEHCYRIAKLMASASLIPDHLKIDPRTKQALPAETVEANCFMIVNQSFRWDFDPFGVAPETYLVGGKLAFQGKLVAAAINARAGLDERLNYSFEGEIGTDGFTVTVSGRIRGEKEARTVRVSVGQAKTSNDMWKKDPEQKLIYTGAIKWARRHTPEIILGVLIDDEVEENGMREASGRVVESTTSKVITGGDTPPADPAPKSGGRKAAAVRKEKESAASATVETAEASDAPEAPDRMTMINDLRDCYKAAGIATGPEAEEVIRKAGLLPVGVGIAGLKNDTELFAIWQKREEIFPVPATTNAGGEQ